MEVDSDDADVCFCGERDQRVDYALHECQDLVLVQTGRHPESLIVNGHLKLFIVRVRHHGLVVRGLTDITRQVLVEDQLVRPPDEVIRGYIGHFTSGGCHVVEFWMIAVRFLELQQAEGRKASKELADGYLVLNLQY